MQRSCLLVSLFFLWGVACLARDVRPLLLQSPTLSKTQIAFAYGGDIWIVDRNGGDARRLVTGTGLESGPLFSPDGSMVAYTGDYDGNEDVYVVAGGGGEPRRLTYHPGTDVALGWTSGRQAILFRSTRNSYSRFERLSPSRSKAGSPRNCRCPWGCKASFSADGSHIAYVPRWNRRLGAVPALRRDQALSRRADRAASGSPTWSDSSIVKVPRDNSNDFNPMWVGDNVYFLSDRNGPVTLFAYDTKTKQ